jgi:hypothetical protein
MDADSANADIVYSRHTQGLVFQRWICDKRGHIEPSQGLEFQRGFEVERRYCYRCLIDFLDQYIGQVRAVSPDEES